MPALCFTSLARSASAANLVAWAPLLVNMAAAISTGWAVGSLTARLVRPPPALLGHTAAAAGFGNVANLLLVLSDGLCRGSAARTALLPPGSAAAGSAAACSALGGAYVMTPVLVATLAQLVVVEGLLRKKEVSEQALPSTSEMVPLSAAERGKPLAGTPSGVGFESAAAAGALGAPPPTSSLLARFTATLRHIGSSLLRPPSASTLAGAAAGCTPAIKAALFGIPGATASPPLAALTGALETLGAAMVPVILVGLGAELAGGGGGEEAEGEPPPPLPARVFCATAAARLVLMPVLGVAALAAARAAHLYAPPDGLFDVVAHLAWATPAAAILSLIASREGNAPGVMARLLLASYAGSAFTLPLFMSGLLRWVVVPGG